MNVDFTTFSFQAAMRWFNDQMKHQVPPEAKKRTLALNVYLKDMKEQVSIKYRIVILMRGL